MRATARGVRPSANRRRAVSGATTRRHRSCGVARRSRRFSCCNRFCCRRRLGIGIALLVVCACCTRRGSRAEAAATTLDPVVVTAARGPQRLADLTADVTVIGREEIARAGVQSLAELLQRQPGIQISMNGGAGVDERRLSARRQRQPDAGADRWHARRFGHRGRDCARSDSARSHRPHRDSARTRRRASTARMPSAA